MERWQAGGRVKAVDRLHQVEGRPDHGLVRTGGDQAGMRHVGAGESGEHPRLAPHGLVGIVAQVAWRPAQDIGPAGPLELQQQVLRPAGQGLGPFDRSRAETLAVHPGLEDGQVDHPRPGGLRRRRGAHGDQAAAEGRAAMRANQAFTQVASSGIGWPT